MFFGKEDADKVQQILEAVMILRNRQNKRDTDEEFDIRDLLENPAWMPELLTTIQNMTEVLLTLQKLFVSQNDIIQTFFDGKKEKEIKRFAPKPLRKLKKIGGQR